MQDQSPVHPLKINLAANTGALKYGASGFLYGLGNDGIPSANVLAPLRPQVAAQKPEGGLQHPNGDAFDVAKTYQAAGGKEIQIYMQDVYPSWPYENLGLADYLPKVMHIVRQVMDRSWCRMNFCRSMALSSVSARNKICPQNAIDGGKPSYKGSLKSA